MIHVSTHLKPREQIYYRSENKKHSLEEIYSFLFKSLRSGNENNAIYCFNQIPYKRLLKFQLTTFVCENCPNIHIINQMLKTKKTDVDEWMKWIIRLCRIAKSRIVINAFRVVSYKPFKPSEASNPSIQSINFLYSIPSNLSVDYIDKNEEKNLVSNAYIIWQLLSKQGIKQTMKEIYELMNTIDGFPYKGLFERLNKFLNNRYLDVIFLFLSFTSLQYSTNITYLNVIRTDEQISIESPDMLELPSNIYDIHVKSKQSNNSYHFYFQNLLMNPSTNETLTDKFGIDKFVKINQPLEQSIVEYINSPEIKTICLARFPDKIYALGSKHKQKRKYTMIIMMKPIKFKSQARSFILADMLKAELNMNSLNRHIINHEGKQYLIQKNFLPINETCDFNKNEMKETIYNRQITCFYPESMFSFVDDGELMNKIFQMLIFHRMIGYPFTDKYSIIIYNEDIYSLTDKLGSYYPNSFFNHSLTSHHAFIFKQAMNRYWRDITKIIHRFYKTISSNKTININHRIRMLYELSKLKNVENWKFQSEI